MLPGGVKIILKHHLVQRPGAGRKNKFDMIAAQGDRSHFRQFRLCRKARSRRLRRFRRRRGRLPDGRRRGRNRRLHLRTEYIPSDQRQRAQDYGTDTLLIQIHEIYTSILKNSPAPPRNSTRDHPAKLNFHRFAPRPPTAHDRRTAPAAPDRNRRGTMADTAAAARPSGRSRPRSRAAAARQSRIPNNSA
ncbi:hypothetical protein SDC9_149278 [bioreactor metagenome]|uniref:Uncharacterized protein n=1 Tax=bioreactor metagenome TaxID=1076179 RepID=A0A645EJ63_9ZZZZ